MNVARSDCSIDSKDEIEWKSANSLVKCQNWAENKCNATIAVYWPENWCEGYTTSCKYGEEAYNVNSIVHFCKKGRDFYFLCTLLLFCLILLYARCRR